MTFVQKQIPGSWRKFPLGVAKQQTKLSIMQVHLANMVSLLLAAALCGCGTTNVRNPSVPVTRSEAKAAIKEMAGNPKIFQRPVVVLSGILDPGIAATLIKWSLDDVVETSPIITSSFATCGNFNSARDALIAEIEKQLPSENPSETIEVDVIAHSMGGLVARYASLPGGSGKRLRIARLFTLATPHQGAILGGGPLPINALAADMGKDSTFIRMMNEIEHPYPIIPYVMLGDSVVGPENAAPKGQTVRWVDCPWLSLPHVGVVSDKRVLADIFRRLRGETPFTTDPPAPLPVRD